MSAVWSCNEWDQLEEVIVGNPLKARFPTPDVSTRLAYRRVWCTQTRNCGSPSGSRRMSRVRLLCFSPLASCLPNGEPHRSPARMAGSVHHSRTPCSLKGSHIFPQRGDTEVQMWPHSSQ